MWAGIAWFSPSGTNKGSSAANVLSLVLIACAALSDSRRIFRASSSSELSRRCLNRSSHMGCLILLAPRPQDEAYNRTHGAVCPLLFSLMIMPGQDDEEGAQQHKKRNNDRSYLI